MNGQARAWRELDLDALQNNVNVLRGLLPQGCALMAVVKANAYGHGAVPVARALNAEGIDHFCVATVAEGVELRSAGIMGEILVLGYTHPSQFELLYRHQLTQTLVDVGYAALLNAYGKPLMAHIKVDTGMHRLGEKWTNTEALAGMFSLPHIRITGMFTHLATADGEGTAEKAFAKQQIERFYAVVHVLEGRGIPRPRLHIQSSAGIFHHSELHCDGARPGMALYGMLSNTMVKGLQPVLNVRTRVAALREVAAGDSVGYGLDYTAQRPLHVATLSIGYADGIPRQLQGGHVLIGAKKAPLIGRICMDAMMADVTDIPGVLPGDIATVLGSAGNQRITACDIAVQAGTIANEVLSRLGERLEIRAAMPQLCPAAGSHVCVRAG